MLIADALEFLRGRLNAAMPRDAAGASAEDLFVYAGANGEEAVTFPANAVSLILVRLEEDPTHRRPDQYLQVTPDGVRKRSEPDIRLNMFVLVVARFPEDYRLSLHHLSRVVGYFQNHRVFNRENSPELHERIPQLMMELVTLSFAEQNEILERAARLVSTERALPGEDGRLQRPGGPAGGGDEGVDSDGRPAVAVTSSRRW